MKLVGGGGGVHCYSSGTLFTTASYNNMVFFNEISLSQNTTPLTYSLNHYYDSQMEIIYQIVS